MYFCDQSGLLVLIILLSCAVGESGRLHCWDYYRILNVGLSLSLVVWKYLK